MTVAARLRALLAALPPDVTGVSLSRAAVEGWLAEEPALPEDYDLTVEDVAARVQRTPNTVRRWIAEKRLRAYQPGGRSWRITHAALHDFRTRPFDAGADA